MSLSVKDKVINHYVTRNILEPKLTKYLDPRNVATRKGMGTDYARKMVKDYINKLKQDNEELYVLKMDISKYFYSIDHEILKELLIDKLDSEEYNIISKIIDTTNMEYVNKTIKKYKDKSGIDIPYYEFGKGLPIGNMTSQFLSIFYLYKLDYYIVHDLKLKHYVRYMDDFIIIDKDKEKLKDAKDRITEILEKEYKLRVNKKKTNVSNLKGGVGFLGLTYRLDNNKTIIRIKKSNYEKVKKKVKLNGKLYRKGNLSHQKLFSSIMNYKYSYHFCDNYKILRLIDKDIYGE